MSELHRIYNQPLAPEAVRRVFDLLGLDDSRSPQSFRVLDFGCGGGRYLEALSTRIPKENLVGVDVEAAQLDRARGMGFRALQLDPNRGELPFESASFDAVFSSNVVEHIPRPIYLAYLREIARVLKPGGRFLVGTPNYPMKRVYDIRRAVQTGCWRYYLLDDPTHCNRLGFRSLERDLSEWFCEIRLDPTYIFFERSISLLRRPAVRRRLRFLSNKIFGYCVKPAAAA